MTAPMAAKKMPPLAPGEFRFITKAIEIEKGDGPADGRRRFKMIASSTMVDESSDEIKMTALQDLERDYAKGVNIFTDHDHSVDNVFGRTDFAKIQATGLMDEKTGAPIYDLHIAGVVNEPNPRMIQLADSIDGGYVTFGASIGARVREAKRNKDGGLDIYRLSGKEASLVGIPDNQRSWTYKAAKAARGLSDLWFDDEDEEEVEKALDTEGGSALQRQGLCESCGHDAGCDCTTCDCGGSMHTQKSLDTNTLIVKAEAEDEPEEPATEPTVDADVQDSEEAPKEVASDTPETPAAEEGEDETTDTPEDAEKAFTFAATDVVELAQHVRTLVKAVSDRDDEIVTLKAERDQLADENEEAKKLIEKVLAMPLRPKAVANVADLNKKLPEFLAPEVREFLTKSAGDNR